MENICTLRPGTILSGAYQYRIDCVLGIGGFGITYKAISRLKLGNIDVGVPVCIKEHFPGDYCFRGEDGLCVLCQENDLAKRIVPDSLKDFIGEAKRLRQIGTEHPNIVKVNEVITANNTAYYVMEYIEGESLYQHIVRLSEERKTMSERDMEILVYPIIDAMAFLHEQRLTHLDIKPENIMLRKNEDGSISPVLIDFGLSKHYGPDGSPTSNINLAGGTSDGYSPSEQYAGISTFSPTADVYALGATLLHCASGIRPTKSSEWPKGQPETLIGKLQVSESLRKTIARAMAASKFDRFENAAAIYNSLINRTEASKAISSYNSDSNTQILTKPDKKKQTGVKTLFTKIINYINSPKPETEDLLREANLHYDSADYTKALELYTEYYQRTQDVVIANNIGLQYENGLGVPKNSEVAYGWYRTAAEKGLVTAMFNLGHLLYLGDGVPQNYEEAASWFKKASDAGNAAAKLYLGIMYENGYGVKPDFHEALWMYREGAEAGNSNAMYCLALCYLYGDLGITPSRKQAIVWLKKAAEKGNSSALEKLQELEQSTQ